MLVQILITIIVAGKSGYSFVTQKTHLSTHLSQQHSKTSHRICKKQFRNPINLKNGSNHKIKLDKFSRYRFGYVFLGNIEAQNNHYKISIIE